MTESEVRAVAEQLLAQGDLKGYRAVFAEAHLGRSQADRWTLLFDVTSPGGQALDTPMIVHADDRTGQARVFETL